MKDELGAELEIRAEAIQSGGGGDDLKIAGGDQGDFRIVLIKELTRGGRVAKALDFNAFFGVGEELVVEDGVDFSRQIGPQYRRAKQQK